MTCEKCWEDAYRMSYGTGRSQAECYHQLLKERENNPCSAEERAGQFWDKDKKIDKRTNQEIMNELSEKGNEILAGAIMYAIANCDKMTIHQKGDAMQELKTLQRKVEELEEDNKEKQKAITESIALIMKAKMKLDKVENY